MVAVALSAGSVAHIRFGISHLWEVITSVRVLRRPDLHVVHEPWVATMRPALADAGLVERDTSLLWSLIPHEPSYAPDFLTPTPLGLVGDLDAELARLRATPAEIVRGQLDLLGPARSEMRRMLARDPAAGLRRLTKEISEYWRIALSRDWPRIRALLDAEVATRAHTLARDGAAALSAWPEVLSVIFG